MDDDDWEDCEDEDMEVDQKQKIKKPEIWDDKKEPLKEDEELEYDGSAYMMLHRSKVEWPCLSIDFMLKERAGADGPANPVQWFPS